MNKLTAIPRLSEILKIYPQTRALFFDMDGTLCDSEHLHAKAFAKMSQDHQINIPYPPEIVHQKLVGKADHFVFEEVKSWPGFPSHFTLESFRNEKNKNLLDLLDLPQKLLNQEMNILLNEIKENKLILGLVTSSEKIITEKIIKNSDVTHLFDFFITRDDCPKHKPDPYPYLKAIEYSKLAANECVIFEDSQVGLDAAIGSGANYFWAQWY